ncbi:MAG: hypothetical protein SNJ53_03595 [Thermodesulfovibrionales bacterium]
MIFYSAKKFTRPDKHPNGPVSLGKPIQTIRFKRFFRLWMHDGGKKPKGGSYAGCNNEGVVGVRGSFWASG